MRRLVVNADDFGLSPANNRGVLEAHHNGIVTSTTVMINYPDAPAAIEQALASAPDLGLGLHLDLTSGRPASDPATVPSLVDANGAFRPIDQWSTFGAQLVGDEIRREFEAQFERFVSLAGRKPDHLDSHYHVTYVHPDAFAAMLELAAAHHLPLRESPVPLGGEDHAAHAAVQAMVPNTTPQAAAEIVERLREVLAQGPAPIYPARFEGGFWGVRANLGDLLVILTTLPEDSTTELMCHPGYADETTLVAYPGLAPRIEELRHLTDPATRECVQASFLMLATFADLMA